MNNELQMCFKKTVLNIDSVLTLITCNRKYLLPQRRAHCPEVPDQDPFTMEKIPYISNAKYYAVHHN